MRGVLIGAVLALILLATATAVSASDYRSNFKTWLPNPSDFGSGWDGALGNGALVWDNVTNQCHDFRRLVSGTNNPDITIDKYVLDGKGGYYGITIEHGYHYPDEIVMDYAETWHLNINVPPQNSSLDAWSVFAHEMGHTLHLDGTLNPPPGPTMTENFGDYYGKIWLRTLESYDMTHERTLYPPGTC